MEVPELAGLLPCVPYAVPCICLATPALLGGVSVHNLALPAALV